MFVIPESEGGEVIDGRGDEEGVAIEEVIEGAFGHVVGGHDDGPLACPSVIKEELTESQYPFSSAKMVSP